ncbi:MAG: DNA repair protein RecO [Elusimicrobiaceae bacterium]|nr:DNA repair protein RecO [Elusimicrobiaceae bacterium]
MIFTDSGIVLFRQDFREADRVIALYTLEHGRMNLRLPGVNRDKGKLKAFSEPFSCANYRIYVKKSHVMGTVTGGKLEHIFPAIRHDLKRQSLALHFCELMMRLTPMHQPSAEKYRLLLQALTELELSGANSAFATAFTLRLMKAAGFGIDHPVLQITPQFWEKMHFEAFSSLIFEEPDDMLSLAKCNEICRRFLNQYLNFPLQTIKSFALPEEELPPFSTQKQPSSLHSQDLLPSEVI